MSDFDSFPWDGIEGEEKPFTPVPNEFLRDGTISPGAKVVYSIIASYIGPRKESPAWPSQDTLAVQVGCSEKTVRKYLDELEDRNLIEQERTGAMKSNRYYIRPTSKRKTAPPDVKLNPGAFAASVKSHGVKHANDMDIVVLSSMWNGLTRARVKVVRNFLDTAPAWLFVEWMLNQGFTYRQTMMIGLYLKRSLLTYPRKNIEEWIKRNDSHKQHSSTADLLFAFTESEWKTHQNGYTPEEIKALRAKYRKYLVD